MVSDPKNVPKIIFLNLFIFYIRIRFQKATNHFSIFINLKFIEESHIFCKNKEIWSQTPTKSPKLAKNPMFLFLHILHQNTLPKSYWPLFYLQYFKIYGRKSYFRTICPNKEIWSQTSKISQKSFFLIYSYSTSEYASKKLLTTFLASLFQNLLKKVIFLAKIRKFDPRTPKNHPN